MRRKIIAVFAGVILAAGLAGAQGSGPDTKKDERHKDAPPVQAPGFAPHVRSQGPVFHGPGPHMGDWLRRNETLPPDQQLRKLEQNPDFQRLPDDGKQRLRDRLQKFNNLPPEQKDRILANMERYEHLPPDQQQRLHEMFRDYRGLPPERKDALRRAFHDLEGMNPAERQKLLDSPDYRNNFSDQERGLLRGMSTIGITPSSGHPGPLPSR